MGSPRQTFEDMKPPAVMIIRIFQMLEEELIAGGGEHEPP